MQTSSLGHVHAGGGGWGDPNGAQTPSTFSDWPLPSSLFVFSLLFPLLLHRMSHDLKRSPALNPSHHSFLQRFRVCVYTARVPPVAQQDHRAYLPLPSFNSITTAAIDASESADFCG